MLHIEALRVGYGGGTVCHEVGLEAAPGQVHAVVGLNGAGKTTLLHAIAGLLRPTHGRIRLHGSDITNLPTHRRAQAGIALVPQGRRIFPSLTVAEHLAIAFRRSTARWDQRHVLEMLPQLAARLHHRGGQLSGGEQQMLAIARALLTQPRLLLADEPTEGLAPALAAKVRDLLRQLADTGLAVLLTTPTPQLAEGADRVTVLIAGRVTAAAADPGQGRLDPDRLRAALATGATPITGPPPAATSPAAEPASADPTSHPADTPTTSTGEPR